MLLQAGLRARRSDAARNSCEPFPEMRLHKDLGVNIENALQHRRRGVELHYWKHGSLAELYDDHILSLTKEKSRDKNSVD